MESEEHPGLSPNNDEYECRHCGEVWDYRNSTMSGAIDVSEFDVKRICPSIDAGFVMHTEGDK
jgi:hypothetical protein